MFPLNRNRRLRNKESLRNLIREYRLHPHDFIAPLFIIEGKNKKTPIESMPGYYRLSIDNIKKEVKSLWSLGIQSVLLFPKVDDKLKDNLGKEALNPHGLIQKTIKEIKNSVVVTGFYGDEWLLRNPFYVHALLSQRDINNLNLIDKIKNCYMKNYFEEYRLKCSTKCNLTTNELMLQIYNDFCGVGSLVYCCYLAVIQHGCGRLTWPWIWAKSSFDSCLRNCLGWLWLGFVDSYRPWCVILEISGFAWCSWDCGWPLSVLAWLQGMARCINRIGERNRTITGKRLLA